MQSPFSSENNLEYTEQENVVEKKVVNPKSYGTLSKHYHINVYVLFDEYDSELQLQV